MRASCLLLIASEYSLGKESNWWPYFNALPLSDRCVHRFFTPNAAAVDFRTKIIDCFQALVRLVSCKAAGFFGAKSSLSRRDINEARRLFESQQICIQSCNSWFSCFNHSHESSYFDRIYSAFEQGGVLGIC
jgi:hypothetical protein